MKIKLLSEEALKKKYPNSNKGSILLPNDKTLWLPSESLALNWQLGGGIPYGKIVELFGYESTGKSLLATGFGKTTQSLGGVILWADAENAFQPQWMEQNGIDLNRIIVNDSNAVEELSDWSRDQVLYWRSKLTNNEPILLVWDSLAALECLVNINSDDVDSKAQMGNRAKAIYQYYRKRQHFFSKMGVVVIKINQVRKKLGASMFESNETTPGGESTRFYASIRIGINGSKQIKGKMTKNGFKDDNNGKKMGRNCSIQIYKNKVSPPKNTVKSQVYFLPDIWGYTGFSKYHGLPEILVEEGVVEKRGSRYYYKDHMICNGEDAFINFLHNEPKKRKILIGKSSINTVGKTREKMESIEENLYPVKAKAAADEE